MRMFRAMIRDPAYEQGAAEVLLNPSQVVFVMPNPYEADTTFVRMTGEANVYLVLAPFADVRDAIEDATT